MKPGKTGWALKVPLTPRFGGPSENVKLFFQPFFVQHKYYLPHFYSLTILGIFPIFHLIFLCSYLYVRLRL